MEQIFATYFRILRNTPAPSLLSPVLAGLSKFAHLINIDFFDDLFSAFETLLAKQVADFARARRLACKLCQ